ncbi:hypothetical protein [Rheinheimera maricola]|uniref:DUF2834 domain-containing protein n=1 Tax=Rheinheimera maricola TaxID=2793282 RepID=A0ABS7XAV7_9GAMM|nr:hypothetical protein [Rheinheimera maricola]MBZ9612698.1 hypothetical protein [Rheinheimera maricola]
MRGIKTLGCELLGALVVVVMFSPLVNILMHEPDKDKAVYLLFLISVIDTCGMIGYAAYNIHAKRRGHDVVNALVYPLVYAPLAACWYIRRYLNR